MFQPTVLASLGPRLNTALDLMNANTEQAPSQVKAPVSPSRALFFVLLSVLVWVVVFASLLIYWETLPVWGRIVLFVLATLFVPDIATLKLALFGRGKT